jgi:5-methylcytosine-specific restriction endonuclease McrA
MTSTQRGAEKSSAAMQSSVLVLNRLYVAIQVISVRRAFCLLCKDLAEVVSVENGSYASYNFQSWREVSEWKAQVEGIREHEDWIQAVNFEIQVPRVIRLLSYDLFPRNIVKFNRRNIFLRDENRCQYCGHKYSTQQLSLDHVIPRSQGGQTNWENIVCACLKCNVRKGGRTPYQAGMKLYKRPVKPKRSPMLSHQLTIVKYESWKQFLDEAYWNVELEHE